jgi:hypothetical protein
MSGINALAAVLLGKLKLGTGAPLDAPDDCTASLRRQRLYVSPHRVERLQRVLLGAGDRALRLYCLPEPGKGRLNFDMLSRKDNVARIKMAAPPHLPGDADA